MTLKPRFNSSISVYTLEAVLFDDHSNFLFKQMLLAQVVECFRIFVSFFHKVENDTKREDGQCILY